MTVETVAAGAVQVIGGVAISPLLVGLTQQVKARLQGRRGPGPLQPYRELRRLWGKSGVAVEGATVVYLLAPLLVAAALGAAILLVPATDAAPGLASATTRSRWPACSPSPGFAICGCCLGHLERFRAPGGEPRPDLVGVRRGSARSLARGCGARRRHDRPPRHRRRHGRRRPLDGPGARARSGRLRTRRGRRDGPAAGRQPRHASRADDDSRGACARVRAAAIWPAPVGARCPPLDRARARGLDLPPASSRGLVAARGPADRARPALRRRSRSWRRSSRRCASCSCRG